MLCLALIDGGTDNLTAGDSTVLKEVTGAATLGANDNIIVLTGINYVNSSRSSDRSGSHALKTTSATTANEDLIIVWSVVQTHTLVLTTSRHSIDGLRRILICYRSA